MGTNGCLQGTGSPPAPVPPGHAGSSRGCQGQPRQILAMTVKAQVTAAPVPCPLPGDPEVGSRAIVSCRPGIASRPDPLAGINRDTVRAPAADADGAGPGQRCHLAGVPGRRLTPAAQPAKSPGSPPGDDDLDAAAAHPGQGGGRQPAPPAGQQPAPGALATGHGGPRRIGPVSGKDCRRPGSTTGTDPGRGRTAPSPVPRTAHSTLAERSGKTGRSLASPQAQPVSLVLTHAGGAGLTFPYSVAGAREARQLRGNGSSMTRYVIGPDVAIRLAQDQAVIRVDHQILAPALLRSQVLSLLYQAVRRGEMTRKDAERHLEYVRGLRIRLLGDRVLQNVAWKAAVLLGWPDTYDAEYVALTQLHADALITLDRQLAGAVKDLVTVAPIEALH